MQFGALKITYPDGTAKTYGTGKPKTQLIFKTPGALHATFRSLTLGFGEHYMDGSIEVDGPLEELMRLVYQNAAAFRELRVLGVLGIRNWNRKGKQQAQIQHHYDLGNDFYKLWLDKSMTYSCAYFKKPSDSLEKAQKQKVAHLLRKLQLRPGMHMLDIGSGWGELLITAAKEHGATGLGITLSQEQFEHSNARAKRLGLSDKIRFELVNYQDLPARGERYDRIISVGMFEHVGRGNQRAYFSAINKLLKPGAVSVLHTISGERGGTDPWMDRYIFPGGYIPAVKQVVGQLAKYDFRLFDYENLRLHYAMTLDEWWRRFEQHKKEVVDKYDERFYRMWRLYLAACAANFRYGDLGLSQFVFTKGVNNELPLTREFLYK